MACLPACLYLLALTYSIPMRTLTLCLRFSSPHSYSGGSSSPARSQLSLGMLRGSVIGAGAGASRIPTSPIAAAASRGSAPAESPGRGIYLPRPLQPVAGAAAPAAAAARSVASLSQLLSTTSLGSVGAAEERSSHAGQGDMLRMAKTRASPGGFSFSSGK